MADHMYTRLPVATPRQCPPEHRTRIKSCSRMDQNAPQCEQSRTRSVIYGSHNSNNGTPARVNCWFVRGKCVALWVLEARREVDHLLADLDKRGCLGLRIGLPSTLRSTQSYLNDGIVRCGSIDGWKPILGCAHMARHSPCHPAPDAMSSPCNHMTLVNGHGQCYTREPNETQPQPNETQPPPKWDKTVLTKALVCGRIKPCNGVTQYIVKSFLERWQIGQVPGQVGHRVGCPNRTQKLLVVLDKACNGCGDTASAASNPWHRMTRMFTVWKALKAMACAKYDGRCSDAPLPEADLLFTKNIEIFPNASRTGFGNLVGGSIVANSPYSISRIQWCSYDKLLLLPYAAAVFFDPYSSRNPDQLWSLSYGRDMSCAASEAAQVWQTFVRDMLSRMNLRVMLWPTYFNVAKHHRTVTVCLLLRTDPSKRTGLSSSWRKSERMMPRYEAPGCVDEMHQTLGGVCHGHAPLQARNVLFKHGSSLREQVSQMEGCRVAIGIHGAQLMNVMWMPPGSSVVEFHRLEPKDVPEMAFYYRNVASLSGHTYFSRQICDTVLRVGNDKVYEYPHCAGFAKPDGVHLQMDEVRQVAIAAVAAVGHAGGNYDDRPIAQCKLESESASKNRSRATGTEAGRQRQKNSSIAATEDQQRADTVRTY